MPDIPLRLEQMISAPLTAIIQAQKESATATLQFLLSQLEEKEEAGKRKKFPTALEFSYSQILQDPETGKIEPIPMKISIPILTLIPIPYISIDEAEIDFKAKIVATKQEKQLPVLYAVYGSKVSVDLTAELNVKIKAKRADLPEGVAKMITTLSNSIPVSKDEGK
ncbi:MAG: DUF2589 domain-containing protein [Archaeoglobaceae archaeon]|nr:DUF2589 domain-containing protein [Archaeoglobaceae archaeon]MDW8128090.1 DUF2589 domain-containing protein [Archaeoglobaceae archaeon]